MNQRNLDFVYQHNPRKYFPLVDNKVITKKILKKIGIPTPETIAVVSNFLEIDRAINQLKKEKSFVIKPSRGRAGGGVMLIDSAQDIFWKGPSGKRLTEGHLKKHLGDILFGVYSFGRTDDNALIEHKANQHPFFQEIYNNKGIAEKNGLRFRNKSGGQRFTL